ncbi:hypothetical protein P7C73_g6679, partial [Tremellales sp. Uapishka_1]
MSELMSSPLPLAASTTTPDPSSVLSPAEDAAETDAAPTVVTLAVNDPTAAPPAPNPLLQQFPPNLFHPSRYPPRFRKILEDHDFGAVLYSNNPTFVMKRIKAIVKAFDAINGPPPSKYDVAFWAIWAWIEFLFRGLWGVFRKLTPWLDEPVLWLASKFNLINPTLVVAIHFYVVTIFVHGWIGYELLNAVCQDFMERNPRTYYGFLAYFAVLMPYHSYFHPKDAQTKTLPAAERITDALSTAQDWCSRKIVYWAVLAALMIEARRRVALEKAVEG